MRRVLTIIKELAIEIRELKKEYEIYFFPHAIRNPKAMKNVVLLSIFSTILALLLLEPVYKMRLPFSEVLWPPETSAQTLITASKGITFPNGSLFFIRDSGVNAYGLSTFLIYLIALSTYFVRFARRRFEELKVLTDLFLSTIVLFIASPFLFLAGALIKLTSKGPVIYRQDRVGRHGKIFRIYKLRTMITEAEKDSGAVWAKVSDPRITPVGRVLRKTHIDELPQFLNVIKGEMSIVGPRPERPEIVSDLSKQIGDYQKRQQIKPGITGLAQVYHKYDETIADVRKKIKYDLLYMKKKRWFMELGILTKTLVVSLTGKGAR